MKLSIEQLLKPENAVERSLLADTDFLAGLSYGKPRPGHPEGEVVHHIKEVLANVDKWCTTENRDQLRLIALIHDTFKYKVDRDKPKVGSNHHARIAQMYAKYNLGILDQKVLVVIELHDDAYNIWRRGNNSGNWQKARDEGFQLIKWLDDAIDLYLAFYKCDNATGDKTDESYQWFVNLNSEYTLTHDVSDS